MKFRAHSISGVNGALPFSLMASSQQLHKLKKNVFGNLSELIVGKDPKDLAKCFANPIEHFILFAFKFRLVFFFLSLTLLLISDMDRFVSELYEDEVNGS